MDAMEIDDEIYVKKNLTMEGLVTRADFQRRKQTCRGSTVCLVTLCFLLLAANIGQIIYYKIIHRSVSDSSQVNFNALTQQMNHLGSDGDSASAAAADRKQIEVKLHNVPEEKDQLKQSYDSVSAERDELKNAKERLQKRYDTLKRDSSQLQLSYDDAQKKLDNVTVVKDQLQAENRNLMKEKDELTTRFNDVTTNRDQIHKNYSLLQTNKDELQRRFNVLTSRSNQLQTSYNSLWKDKEQLQSRYNRLWRTNDWLQRNYSSLVTDKDRLQNLTNKMAAKVRGIRCPTGWSKFDISCYFISTQKKDWMESRKACVAQDADLVIIESRDEQEFVNSLMTTDQNAWIGLSDSLQEGTWTWVDGSLVTTTFWQPGQPNSFNGNQDCGEFVYKSSGGGEWNDDGCFAEQTWICEK